MTFTLTGAELASIILALATLTAAVGALFQARSAATKVDTVHAAVNGQTAHLVALTAASSYAAGQLATSTAAAPASAPPSLSLPIGVMGVAGAPPAPPTAAVETWSKPNPPPPAL